MRAYRAASEEAVRTLDLLKDWRGDGLISGEQYERMAAETGSDLRRTNLFLRLVLFLFTLIIVGAAVGLVGTVLFEPASERAVGFFLLFCAALCYGGTEVAVAKGRFYRFGIEEALATCSVGLLSIGLYFAVTNGVDSLSRALVSSAAGALASLWMWYRFGFAYALPAAMVFAAWLATCWTSSATNSRLMVEALYAAGLVAIAVVRPRYRLTYLDRHYSLAEAVLWLGVYVSLNLRLTPEGLLGSRFILSSEWPGYPTALYWATWVLIWCLPVMIVARGVRLRDSFLIRAGAVAGVLTLLTNKPYLGWQRHSWDAMLLGVLLIGVAIVVRRWLSHGPDGIRHGLTARRLSSADKRLMNAGVTAVGLVPLNVIAPTPQTGSSQVRFGGGDSGGAGASSDY